MRKNERGKGSENLSRNIRKPGMKLPNPPTVETFYFSKVDLAQKLGDSAAKIKEKKRKERKNQKNDPPKRCEPLSDLKKRDTASNELYSLLFNYFLSFTSHRKVNKLCLSFWQLKIILLAVRV